MAREVTKGSPRAPRPARTASAPQPGCDGQVASQVRYQIAELERFASALFGAAGMDADKASTVARLLVLTDAMGRRTHGLAMSPLYLADIRKGGMRVTGEPRIVNDSGVTAVWDGDYLPGLWLMQRAIETAIPRAAQHGLAAIAIRRSHHIGCLAVLVKQAADRGLVALIDPAFFAGREAFIEQTEHLSQRCRSNRPIRADHPVRVPGDQAARHLAQAQAHGIGYDDSTWRALRSSAQALGVEPPAQALQAHAAGATPVRNGDQ